jgi:hypothetical protein
MPQTIRLVGTETDSSRPQAQPRVPPGPPPPHGEKLGDQRVFTDELRAPDSNNNPTGPVLGEHSGFCTLVRKGPGSERIYQCLATFRLNKGLITGRALFDLNAAGTVKGPITGGTDDYKLAQGEITTTFPAPNTTLFVIELA